VARKPPFSRSPPRFQPQPRLLILCEDSKASIDYLKDAAKHFRASPHVEVSHCHRTDPIGIVEEAIRRVQRPSAGFDRALCVFDRNGHERFDEALALAHRHQRVVAIPSYPCFEYWLLLHFEYARRPFTAVGNKSSCDRLHDELKAKPGMNAYDKGSVRGLFDRLHAEQRFAVARSHAPRALAEAERDDSPNPSTHLHLVIDRLEQLGTLQPVEPPHAVTSTAPARPLPASRAGELIRTLNLQPHPEGGWYREIFRSPQRVHTPDGRRERSAVTTIDFLLAAGQCSAWHRVRSDEVWHLLEGGPLRLWWMSAAQDAIGHVDLAAGDATLAPRHVVPADTWQAAEPLGDFAYVGATVAPGFEFADFDFMRSHADAVQSLQRLQPALARLL
jgi:uncharacterized protein